MTGIYTSPERLYLDAAGNVVKHDNPNKVSLLVAEGGTLPMERAKELGLVTDTDEKAQAEKRKPAEQATKRGGPQENK